MSNSKEINNEDLKKLENEAYFELCQIIAEAMQLQDVNLLDARIMAWKIKYKKLLDKPSTQSNTDFKKRIQFLLTQYYSSVTQYILSQLKLNENKKIENQAKALKELYTIIKNINDLNLLKSKVKKWESKYPIKDFLSMYQKRILSYTREKNLEANAFEQEKAFDELVQITKKVATFDELTNEIADWEKKYSINNKYTIDDFLKHQSEIKRFTSPEFLQSIAKDKSVDHLNINGSSSEVQQANAYRSLIAISKGKDSVDAVFEWVYNNRYLQFNGQYKDLILANTYLDYSPNYLKKLSVPNIDVTSNSLTYEEFQNIDDIKRYAVISYFNLLLPAGQHISNDYFERNIDKIYNKSNNEKYIDSISSNILAQSGIEMSLVDNQIYEKPTTSSEPNEIDIPLKESHINLSENSPEEKSNIMITFYPIFLETIYSRNKQANLITIIDTHVNEYSKNKVNKDLNLENEFGFEKTKI